MVLDPHDPRPNDPDQTITDPGSPRPSLSPLDSNNLDPADWQAFRAQAHRIVDASLDHLAGRRNGPAWRAMPDPVRDFWDAPLPEGPTPLGAIWDDLARNLLPYGMGSTHPRFFGWYMGGGNATGALADFIAGIEGSNLGGGATAAAKLDGQVCRWLLDAMGFPEGASATLVSGGSLANLIGLTVARNAVARTAFGVDVRADGVTDLPQPLVFYASDQTHTASLRAIETLGLGGRALRLVPSGADYRIDLTALAAAIDEDRARGLKPACIIGSAGTTSTGAVDDLNALADLAQAQGLWFHVDGAIGAVLRLSPRYAGLVAGMERADSLAMDLHKWFQAPFECGAALLRDGARHFATFAMHPAYLEEKARGVASGPLLADYNLELSRSLKALKVWMALREHGSAAFGRLIDHQIGLARRLTHAVQAAPDLELAAPTVLNIVCYRHRGRPGMTEAEARDFNIELMLRIQESGLAVPTDTTIKGRHALRAAIVNHRAQAEDIDILVQALQSTGAALLTEM